MYQNNYLIFLGLLMFFSGFYIFCLKNSHLLMMLLSLEFMIMSLFFVLFIYLMMNSLEEYILLYFLIMSVSEGVLGLSLLVCLVRINGNDYFKSFSILI